MPGVRAATSGGIQVEEGPGHAHAPRLLTGQVHEGPGIGVWPRRGLEMMEKAVPKEGPKGPSPEIGVPCK